MDSESALQRAYQREKKARKLSEDIASTVSQKLYTTNLSLEKHVQELDSKILLRTSALENANLLLKTMLHKDALTELPNRLAFDQEFQRRIDATERKTFALLTCDINEFKAINNIYGHLMGDNVLKTISNRFQNWVTKNDFVARIAGDEYVVIINRVGNIQKLKASCQNLLNLLSETIAIDNFTLTPKLSVGVAIFPMHGSNLQLLLMSADYARSIAKKRSLKFSTLQFFEENLKDSLAVNQRIAKDLHDAIALKELYLCFQPVISISCQSCEKFEALLRWQHPVHGNIPPDTFIPIAEETGAIIEIGRLVIEEACKQIRIWLDEGIRVNVSINVSAIQFTDINLLQTINSTLLKYSVPPELLGVEVTESVLDNNVIHTSTIIKAFHDQGITISLDDFGTGYSCLSYIQNLRLDIIKIDKAFINDVETNLQSQGITKAIIQMAHALNLKVVAEGVETRQQLIFLLENDCDFIQGYYFSKPLKAELVSGYLKEFEIENNKKALFNKQEREKQSTELVVSLGNGLCFENDAKENQPTETVISNQSLSIATAVFESSAAIMVTDTNSNILRVNAAFTRITGYTVEDALEHKLEYILLGSHNDAFNGATWGQVNQTGLWEGEMLSVRKNGDAYLQFLTIKAVRNPGGAITHYVSTFIDITERRAIEDEIKSLAFYDPLTQLPNRRLFSDRVKHALVTCSRIGYSCALLLIDIDYLKELNDALGHDFGDLLLKQVAKRISYCIRKADTVARWGGDEFVVLLEVLSVESFEAAAQTEVIAQKILHSLDQPYQLNGHEYRTGASIGVTIFKDNEVALDVILKQADIAMYQAKADGRDTIRFYDSRMQEVMAARTVLKQDLREATQNNSFQLYYKIQVNGNGRAVGAEALICWKHPELGMVFLSDFVTLAEESKLILPIGEWLLDTVCAQLTKWQQNPLMRDLVLTVSVTSMQIYQKDFVKQVIETLQRHGINPARLSLELTESMLVRNISDIMNKMNALKKIGVCFSLDGFGTGFSSLKYLKVLPFNQLKINQSFVHDITAGESGRAFVLGIIRMANSFNINVIADGVETKEQRQCLLDIGCSDHQGCLIGEPLPVNEFEALLKKDNN
jgi:diguanylate cyclase (GGDEF)-like protein/PAS domain S-box-containing protein